jgi:RecA-family ATPase
MTTNTTKNETVSAISAFFKDFQTAHEKEPPKGPKWDQKKPNQISAKHFLLSSASSIPPREWLYGNHLIRGYLSLTVAPGGLGKSSMLLVEAISMVTRRSLFGFAPVHRLRVWYWCGEDPLVEIERRIAAICLHYSIPPEDIGDRLMIDSGREMPIKLAESNRNGVAIIQKTLDQLVATIKKEKIDVLIIDPLITIHEIQENDTMGMNTLVNQLRNVADATGCAIELVHHTSKAGAMASDDFGIYASRGAGALIDGVRSARYLSRMPENVAKKFGLSAKEAKSYFSVNMGKANLAPMDGAT